MHRSMSSRFGLCIVLAVCLSPLPVHGCSSETCASYNLTAGLGPLCRRPSNSCTSDEMSFGSSGPTFTFTDYCIDNNPDPECCYPDPVCVPAQPGCGSFELSDHWNCNYQKVPTDG